MLQQAPASEIKYGRDDSESNRRSEKKMMRILNAVLGVVRRGLEVPMAPGASLSSNPSMFKLRPNGDSFIVSNPTSATTPA